MHPDFVAPLWVGKGLVKKFGAFMVEIKTEKGHVFFVVGSRIRFRIFFLLRVTNVYVGKEGKSITNCCYVCDLLGSDSRIS